MIKLICLGKLKEKYLIELVNDYNKRINKYHKLEIIQIKDSSIIEEEAQILKNLNSEEYVISLDIKGKKVTSIEFKETLERLFSTRESKITFIIGASFGLSQKIIEISNEVISFSDLTFPHGLFRGILLEQIYRSFKIMNNENYHK